MPDETDKKKPTARRGNARNAAGRGGRGRVRGGPPTAEAAANGAAPPPNVGNTLRSDAIQTIKDHEARWSDFRTNGGDVLNTYFNQTFSYLQGIIGSNSSPTDWVRDGMALLIGYCGAGRKLYQATYKLFPYQG